MKLFDGLDYLIRLLAEHIRNRRRAVLALACLVVFVTTYTLILPAFTLGKIEAANQGGIDVPGVTETATDVTEETTEEATEEAPAEETTEKTEEAAEAEVTEEAQAEEQPQETAEEGKTEESASEVVTEEKTEKAEEAAGDETDPLKFEGDKYTIAVVDKDSVLPENTSIKVKEIDKSDNADAYEQHFNDALEAVQKEKDGENVSDFEFARFYDISLVSDGNEISLSDGDKVSVNIEYDKELRKALGVEDKNNIRIIHFAENKSTGEVTAEVLDNKDAKVDAKTTSDNLLESMTFDADSFSVYGLVYVKEAAAAEETAEPAEDAEKNDKAAADQKTEEESPALEENGKSSINLGTAVVSTVDGSDLPEDADGHADVVAGKKAIASVEKKFDDIDSDKTEFKVFDIALDNIDENEYKDGFKVDVTLPEGIQGKDFRLFHIHDGKVEELDVQTNGKKTVDGFTFETENFSQFVLSYTVDFEYNGYRFSLGGGGNIKLSDLFKELDIDRSVKDVSEVTFSNPDLVKITHREGILGLGEDWLIQSQLPFRTEETLAITFSNGDTIAIQVTDAQESSELSGFLTNVTISGAQVVDGNYVVKAGQRYGVTMNFKETADLQFLNSATLTYQMPTGVTLTDNVEKRITIAIVSSGRTYEAAANVKAYTDGRIEVKFVESDPNYTKLTHASNVQFRVSLDALFDENVIHSEWGEKIERDIILDDSDDSDAFATKTASFDESTGTYHYTITVNAKGEPENVNVKDIISGNALIFNNDVQVSGNSRSYTSTSLPGGQKGFDYTFSKMNDGETITITYSASLDPTKIPQNGKIAADQTKNTVTVTPEGGDPHHSDYSHEINLKTPTKSDGTAAGKTEDGNLLYDWVVEYNSLALASAANDTITDAIGASSQQYMKYYGDVTVEVYNHNGSKVDVRNFTPGSDFNWSYKVPSEDTQPYKYVFKYKTVVDKEKITASGTDLTLTNTSEGPGGPDSGEVVVGPSDKVSITKAVLSSNPQEVTWISHIHVPEGGLASATVTDTVPSIYSGNIGESGNYTIYDLYKTGSLKVEGLISGEAYDEPVVTDDGKVIISFTKDGQPGLKGTPGGHDITIKLTTLVDQTWLQYGYDHPTGYQADHKNTIDINGIEATATVTFSKPDLQKNGSELDIERWDPEQSKMVKDHYFLYTILVSGASESPIVIDDNFDTNLVEVPTNCNYYNHFKIWGGNQYSQDYPQNGLGVNYSDTENGIRITANNVPLQANGEYYPYYKIQYFLKLKDGIDLETLAAENGGKYELINTANWGDHEASFKFEKKYNFLDKKLIKEATSKDRQVKYQITFNPAKAELNGGATIPMKDTLNENLSIDYTSIQIVTEPEGVEVPYSLSGNDAGETIATYQIPDSTKVTITYDAMVVGNGRVNYKNVVEAHGDKKVVEKTTDINIEGEGIGATADLKIVKVDGYNANNKLAGVQFKLYSEIKSDGTREDLSFDGSGVYEKILTTDKDGVLKINGDKINILFDRKYYVEEIAPQDGYRILSFPYQFTLVDSMDDVHYETYSYFYNDTFQIKNWPLEGLVVGKTVDSPDDTDYTKDFTFEVSILKEDGSVNTDITQKYGDMDFVNGVATFTLRNKEQLSAWDMPAGTKFKVEEVGTEGYVVSHTVDGTTETGDTYIGQTSTEYTLVTFNNSKTEELPGSLNIKKTVTVDGETAAGEKIQLADGTYKFSIYDHTGTEKVTLDADGNPIQDVEITIENGASDTVAVTNLPAGDYVIKEESSDNTHTILNKNAGGYNESLGGIPVTVSSGDSLGVQTAEFTNNYQTIRESVEKKWEGEASQDDRPGSITVELLANGEEMKPKVERTLNAGNDWKASVDNLPKHLNGEEVKYTWIETAIQGYNLTGYTDDGTTATLTNSPTKYDVHTSYVGTKEWSDYDNMYNTREDLQITLYASTDNGKTFAPTNYQYQWVSVAGNSWTYKFDNIPVFDDSTGNVIRYKAVETPLNNYDDQQTVHDTEVQEGTAFGEVVKITPNSSLDIDLTSDIDLGFLIIKETQNQYLIWTHRALREFEKTEIDKIGYREYHESYKNKTRTYINGVGENVIDTEHGRITINYNPTSKKLTIHFTSQDVWTQVVAGQFKNSHYYVGDTSLQNTLKETDLEGRKIWNVVDDKELGIPTLTLHRTVKPDGETETDSSKSAEIVTVKTENGTENLQPVWSGSGNTLTYKYEHLPKYDANGKEYEYTVTEYQFKVGDVTYTAQKNEKGEYTVSPDAEHASEAASFSIVQNGNDITNSELTDYSVTKIWKNADNENEDWVKNLTLILHKKPATGSETTFTYDVSATSVTATGSEASNAPHGVISGNKDDGYVISFSNLEAGYTYYTTEEQLADYKEPSYGHLVIDSEGVKKIEENTGSDAGKAMDGQYITNTPDDAVELPMTGGIGTTIFYILGSILVIGGAIYFVSRRRVMR